MKRYILLILSILAVIIYLLKLDNFYITNTLIICYIAIWVLSILDCKALAPDDKRF